MSNPKKLYCTKCGSNNFSSTSGLTRHKNQCRGLGELDELNRASFRIHHRSDIEASLARKQEEELFQYALHTDGSYAQSYSKKKQKTYHSNKTEKANAESPDDPDFSTHVDYFEDLPHCQPCSVFDDHYGDTNKTDRSQDDYFNSDNDDSDEDIPKKSNHPAGEYSSKQPESMTDPPYNKNVGVPTSTMFSIELADILGRHRTDLSLHDEIVNLVKKFSNNDKLKFYSQNLKKRSRFLKDLEKMFNSPKLKPKDVTVHLTGGEQTTVSVFDLEAQIMSLLQDENLMIKDNLAEGYNVHTGKPTEPVTHYGEIHTGDAWEPARKYFCGDHPFNMPVSLILFGDKSHFDMHGTLATTPLCFTLSCFNKSARNRVEFWRPIAFLPNHGVSKVTHSNKSDKEKSAQKVQDEHACLAVALEQLIDIHKRGGIAMKVLNKPVIGKVWIHFVIGDTAGNNCWMGHYNSSKSKRPYRDCKCCFGDMSLTNPLCEYVTMDEYRDNMREMQRATSKAERARIGKETSSHNIFNAFAKDGMPLSDQKYGIFHLFPPELLHTTYEGITEYMLDTLSEMLGTAGKIDGKDPRDVLDNLHRHFYSKMSRNSDRDMPRGASRSSLLRDTLIGETERRGNLFILLCIAHTETAYEHLYPHLHELDVDPQEFLDCLKLYLSMEEWFHSSNPITEVKAARDLISDCLVLVQEIFKREGGNEWNLPKMHGLTKMQYFMCLYGSGINFFGGPGESNHKKFVKDTGNNTQCRIDSFCSQVALRFYETSLFEIAKAAADKLDSERYRRVGKENDSVNMNMSGRYRLIVHGLTPAGNVEGYHCRWDVDNHKKNECDIHNDFLNTVCKHAFENGWRSKFVVKGVTCLKIMVGDVPDQIDVLFRCTPEIYGEKSWFDWCLLKYQQGNEDQLFPARLLGIFKYETDGIIDNQNENDGGDGLMACVHTASEPLDMDQWRSDFVTRFSLGKKYQHDTSVDDSHLTVVPITSIHHPLFVFENSGGGIDEYLTVLPRREWARYFGSKIKV